MSTPQLYPESFHLVLINIAIFRDDQLITYRMDPCDNQEAGWNQSFRKQKAQSFFFHAVTFDIDILSFFTNKAISQKDIEET